ncbi:hypothetical protein [Rhodanobacter lindaniclasticus]
MTIVFEAYTLAPAHGVAHLPFGARGRDVAGTFGAVRLPFGTAGEDNPTVSPPAHGHTVLALRTFGADAEGAIGRAILSLVVSGNATAFTPPELAIGSVGVPWGTRGHGFTISAPAHGDVTLPFGTFATDAAAFGHAKLALGSSGREDGVLRTATLYQFPWMESNGYSGITLALADGFVTDDTHEADFIQALMDLMRFDARYSVSANVLAALADGMSFADIARAFLQADLVDAFIASEVLEGTAQITVLLRDGFTAGAGTDALAEILAALADGFYATLTIATGADEYTAWVMTTQTKAMRRYRNFPFNSFAVLDGELWGAAADGIYRMGGATDAGAAIAAAIRTGALDFGSQSMKGAPRVYIGATTSGELLLRVQATTIRGEDLQQTYRMVPAVTGTPREHRVEVGRGFRSVYWTFELANDTDGAAFEVHAWHVVPLQHTGKLI